MNYQKLNVSVKDHILTIEFNRPEASNALDEQMISELVQCLEAADEDNNVRCILITGSGKHFSAGGDVKGMKSKEGMFSGDANELRERYKRGIQKIPLTFERLSTPTIAVVNGAAIGAGLDMACMCDIRVASESAKFGETFVKLGLVPGDGGSYFLQRVVGFSKAMEMTLTGNIYDSKQALAMGLVSYAGADYEKKACEFANSIVTNAPIAVQMAKRSLEMARKSDLQAVLDLLAAYQGITQRSEDHFKGLDGLLEKKTPDFNHK